VKEAPFQQWILAVAKAGGWRVWHVPVPMKAVGHGRMVPARSGRGLPDLIMLHDRPPRLIFAEVKGDDGELSDEQREFLRLARGLRAGLATHFDGLHLALERLAGRDIPVEFENPIGVYTWAPGNETLVEAVLLGRGGA